MQCVSTQSWKQTQGIIHFLFILQSKPKNSLLCNKYPDIQFRPDSSFDNPVLSGFGRILKIAIQYIPNEINNKGERQHMVGFC